MKYTITEAELLKLYPSAVSVNAKTTACDVGVYDRGMMTGWVDLEGSGWGQSFGGYHLKDEALYVWVSGILEVYDVVKLSAIRMNAPVRITRANAGWGEKIIGLGHIVEDVWFLPEVAFKDLKK